VDLGAFMADVGIVTVTGSALGLDRRGAFQFMVSQPIVVVPALGLILGHLSVALWLGAVLQLLWMSSLLVGASVPPNETVASVAIGGMVLTYGRHVADPDSAVLALAILIGAPLGHLARLVDVGLDRTNLQLADRADEAARAERPALLNRLPLIGLARIFAATAVLVAPAVLVGFTLLWWIRPLLHGAVLRGFQVMAVYFIPALGLAVALSTVRRRRALLLAAISFAAVWIATWQMEPR
jgi:mannose/fructose/N-acetylgalactosamine-specific phosphotransferase system component IIC